MPPKKKSSKKTAIKRLPLLQEQWLLIDGSNSTSKFALATPERLLSIRRIPTASLKNSTLVETLQDWEFTRVIVACVVPKTTLLLARFFKTKRIPFLAIDATTNLGIAIRYPEPSSIGADRLVNVVASNALYGSPAIVVDFGTAITFDVIDPKGAYLGGIIAPGLKTGADVLHERTALLPKTLPASIRRAVGKNTISAIQSGLLLGARGLVREATERITKENFSKKRPILIATGTDATLVARGTSLFDVVNPTLTLEGLREVGRRIREL